MINCIFLTMILLIILIFNLKIYKNDVVEPAIIFNSSFLISSFVLIFAATKWKVDISMITVLTITFSVILFSFMCYCLKNFFNKNQTINKQDSKENTQKETINIKNWLLISYAVFSLLIVILNVYFTVKAVDGDFKHIGAALYKFRNYTLRYKYELNFPPIIDMLGGIIHASSYYFMYIIINNYIVNKKVNILLIIIVIITSFSTVLDGTRGAIINIILSFIPLFYILYYKHNGKKFKVNRKVLIIFSILCIIFLTQFQKTALILGRSDAKEFDNTDYVYIYLGAPIYNLDSFLNQEIIDEKYIGIHTFSSIYDEFGNFTPENTQSFRTLNGNNIGNVYTILFDFICDGKFIGLLLGIILMASISQIIYETINKKIIEKKDISKPNILILIYAYIFGGLVFAFFGNKFFTQIFNTGVIKYILLWCILNFILFRKKRYLK